MLDILTTEPVPLGQVVPELRGSLERVVMKALERDPRDRYPDAGALAEDLRRRLEGRPVKATGPGLLRRLHRWSRRRRRTALALAGLVGLALLATAWWIGRERSLPHGQVVDAYREVETLLMNAIPLIYEGERTPQRMALAASQLERAESLLDGVPPLSHHDVLRRRIQKELGTSQMLLAELTWDVAPARSACLAFERARDVPYDTSAGRLRDQQLDALDASLVPDVELLGLLASAKLQHHRLWGQPSTLASATAFAESALVTRRRALGDTPPESRAGGDDLGYTFNALAEITTERAWFGGSAAAARLAAAWSDSAYARRRMFAYDWPALGSLLFQRARAYHALGALTRTPALLDTAEAYLEACLEYRGPERPRVFAETREERARLALSLGQTHDDRAFRRHLLLAVRTDLDSARSALQRAHAEEVQVSALRSADAEVFAALAVETRSTAWLDSADARLAACSAAFPPTSFPRPASFHWVRRALVERARNEVTGAPGSAEAAARALANALALSRSRGDSLVFQWVAHAQAGRVVADARSPEASRP